MENANRANVGLQKDLDNSNRANVGLQKDLDHTNRANAGLEKALADITKALKEQEAIAQQKSNDHFQLLKRFEALNVELRDVKHQLQMFHDMVRDGEDLKHENDKIRTYINELWVDIKSMKLRTILAIARARQYELEFDSIVEEWNRNSWLWSLFLTLWLLEETMYIFEWTADVYQAPSGSIY